MPELRASATTRLGERGEDREGGKGPTFTWALNYVNEAGDVVLTLGHSVGRGRGSGLQDRSPQRHTVEDPEETLLG
jgi:hypothetical protein